MSIEQQKMFWNVFRKTFETGDEWKLESIEFDEIQLEVVIFISYQGKNLPLCPVCQSNNVTVLPQREIKKGYYSFLGYQTYIHAPEILIHCPKHGSQKLKTPWENKLKCFFM